MEKTASELAIERLEAAGVNHPDVALYCIAESMGFSPDQAAADWIDQMFDANDPELEEQVTESIKLEAEQNERQRLLLEKLAWPND